MVLNHAVGNLLPASGNKKRVVRTLVRKRELSTSVDRTLGGDHSAAAIIAAIAIKRTSAAPTGTTTSSTLHNSEQKGSGVIKLKSGSSTSSMIVKLTSNRCRSNNRMDD